MRSTDHTYPGLEEALSTDRFASYLGWANGDRNRAIALYTLNVALSESLQAPLHMLEIALRNRIHHVMAAAHGEKWFDVAAYQANPVQADMLAKARRNIADARKPETPGRLVAALTFGYWTAMVGREYEDLWQKVLKDIARREDGKGLMRKQFSKPLSPIRTLRNRIAHHEPILYWDLPKHYDVILQITYWLSPVAAAWSRDVSRFYAVYPSTGISLTQTAATEQRTQV
ncbi:MAG: Abi family protein [Methylacidiphilales bacterium]|nr:Abi family protein [Candidatus Methylacidiphilales bacterium]